MVRKNTIIMWFLLAALIIVTAPLISSCGSAKEICSAYDSYKGKKTNKAKHSGKKQKWQ